MAFDIDMIKKVYEKLPSKIEAARKLVGRPLTLTEKILYPSESVIGLIIHSFLVWQDPFDFFITLSNDLILPKLLTW